jgi:Holliday junction resolvasome RuvABC DNA-binding subunit
MVQLVLRGTGPDGTGVFVNPEVQVALKNIYLPKADAGTENIVVNALQDLYRASVAGSKASKVLLNTIAYPVQLYGNTTTLLGMGINPFKGAIRGADIALAEFGGIEALRKSPEGRKALLDEIQQMARYGIKNANILDSDLRSTLDNGIFSKALGKVTDPLGKAYSVADTMGRYVGWKANQTTLRKLFPNIEASLIEKAKKAGKELSPADATKQADELIQREAAILINDTYQNYDKVSNLFRTLSRWGVVPQFATFTAEFARNQYNQGKVLAKMLNGTFAGIEDLGPANQMAMRIEGAKRLASLTAVYGTTYAAIEGVKASSGLNQEDQDALRNLGYADYDKNRELMVNYDKETRKGWTANASYIIPHAIGLSALKAGMRGEDEASVVGMLSEELIGDGSFIMQEAFRALENKDKSGNVITNEMNELRAAAEKVKYFIAESFRPGISREFDKFSKAKRGAGDLSLAEVGQRQLGLRKNPMDINKSSIFTVSKSNEPAKQESSAYYSMLKWKDPSPEEANAAYQQAARINEESFVALSDNVKSMKQLGFSEDEIVKTMKDAKVSSTKILEVLGGNYQVLPPAKIPSTSDRYDELEGNSAQKRQAINELRKTDRQLGEALYGQWKREASAEKRNLTEKEKVILGLSVGDRASEIMKHPNPDGYLIQLRKKGIATDEVVKLVRLKQRAQ